MRRCINPYSVVFRPGRVGYKKRTIGNFVTSSKSSIMNKKVCFLIFWFLALCFVACHLIERRNNAHKPRLKGMKYSFTNCMSGAKPFKEFVKDARVKNPFSQYI